MVKYRLIGLYSPIDKGFDRIASQLSKTPDNPAIQYGMGLVYARKNQRALAISHLQKALSLDLFNATILMDIGRVFLEE
jgi:Flp pilus assembly protein TadD